MKTRFTQKFLMAFLMMGLFTASQAQTYVNSAATGANDGSSWADAYTDLTAALDAATGDVWVAAGTYKPTNTALDSFNTFQISSAMGLYGGFAGTETSIDDRVDGNVTILSGDMAGDDLDNVFTSNKEDNIFHVVSIDAGASDVVVVDGFTITGGNTSTDNDPDDSYIWAGAGIYSVSSVEVSNCSFDNHYAPSGAAIYLVGDADDSEIDNCTFEKNFADSQSAGAMGNTIDGFIVTNCTFRDNAGARGALYPLRVTGLMIDNCEFTNNVNAGGFGGAMFVWSSFGTIANTTFTGNSAGNAAGIYNDGRETTPGTSHITFDNLTFDGNSSLGNQAAGIQTFNSSHTMQNCLFVNNESVQLGAGHLDGGAGQTSVHNNNVFRNNNSTFGGAQALFGDASVMVINGNTYDSNNASTSGGAIINAFGPIVTVNDCFFEDNVSDAGSGGAIYNQNDTTALEVNRTQFFGNNSNGGAGVIGVGGPVPMTFRESYFEGNSGDFGGAIGGNEASDGEFGQVVLTIDRCIFRENFAATQGAGLSLVDFDAEITNTEFSTNINQGEGAGGAMSLNATDTSTVEVNIVHSTIVSNFGIIGAGIATFTGETDSKLNVKLTNTILANEDGSNYEIEDGTPKFSSLGGNVSSDATTEGAFTNTNDVNNSDDLDAIFVAYDDFNFFPADGSPAIDIGMEVGVNEDIYGNARVGLPDAGAFEGALVTATNEVLENDGQLTMTPNPAASLATVTIENDWTGIINATVTDMTGRVITTQAVNKSAVKQDFILNVSTYNEGNYILTLRAENTVVSTQFIKI